jgi:hypothetical protein
MVSRVRIKEHWEGAGREGVLLFSVRPHRDGRSGEDWSIVLWDDEDDLEPELHKHAGLVPA